MLIDSLAHSGNVLSCGAATAANNARARIEREFSVICHQLRCEGVHHLSSFETGDTAITFNLMSKEIVTKSTKRCDALCQLEEV